MTNRSGTEANPVRSTRPGAGPDGPEGDPALPARPQGAVRPSSPLHAWTFAVLAVLAFVPMLADQPGVVTDDTKTYLYLDPGRYVRQAVSLWDPNVALGTVTHENIGYLFPMGPFYWVCRRPTCPVWVAQRLWLGSILFAAGAGVLLCRTLGFSGRSGLGRVRGGVAFMFTPYVLQYSGRISVILMPWAGLPVAAGLRGPGAAGAGLAVPGALRPGRRPGQRHQRQLDPLRGHRPAAVAALTPSSWPARRRGGRPGGCCLAGAC